MGHHSGQSKYLTTNPTRQHFQSQILMSDPSMRTSEVLGAMAFHSFASQRDHGSHLSSNDFPCIPCLELQLSHER